MRQAVIIIHGIGEQRPMDTLRSFIRNIAGATVRNKPDKMSAIFELRRLQIPGSRDQPLTDFYEYYWAHHMRDSNIKTVVAWMRALVFRKPANVSEKLRGYYYILWVLLLMFIFVIGWAVVKIILGEFTEARIPLVIAAILYTANYFLLRLTCGAIGDAARYLNPAPDNIAQRNKIREEGIKLIDTLHKSKKYTRVIIVGHSLGSVIAYDLIRLYWSTLNMTNNLVLLKQSELKKFAGSRSVIFADAELSKNAKVDRYQDLQLSLWKELREHSWPWLITDFITLGSPLPHADMLLTESREQFMERRDEGEYPACPPVSDLEVYYKQNYETEEGPRTVLRPTHHAPFLCTRWSNIYFPNECLIKGDVVGGPLQPLFGAGVRDIDVDLRGWRGLLPSHTRYWKYRENEYAIGNFKHPTKALRNTMSLHCLRDKKDWPSASL